jgi:hypothetical protein
VPLSAGRCGDGTADAACDADDGADEADDVDGRAGADGVDDVDGRAGADGAEWEDGAADPDVAFAGTAGAAAPAAGCDATRPGASGRLPASGAGRIAVRGGDPASRPGFGSMTAGGGAT